MVVTGNAPTTGGNICDGDEIALTQGVFDSDIVMCDCPESTNPLIANCAICSFA
jgi:hypothetical protein